jgi:hypothetical protein
VVKKDKNKLQKENLKENAAGIDPKQTSGYGLEFLDQICQRL